MTSCTETYPLDWEGIALTVRWTPNWLNMEARGYGIAHLELISDGYAPLPMTETGYRSHFTSRELVETEGGPVKYVKAWLKEAAMSADWKCYVDDSKQMRLL